MARKKSKFDKYRKNQKERSKKNRIFTFVIAGIIVIMILAQLGLLQERRKLEAEQHKIEQQIADEEEHTKDLEKKQKYMTTDEYIKKIAREKFGLFDPDEYILEEK